jgi:hypothetical protein
MDWTLAGALVGVTILAGTVGYELFVIARSNPAPAQEYQAPRILLPARERAVVNASSDVPAVVVTPATQTSAPQINAPPVYTTASSPQYSSRVEILPPVGGGPKDHSPPPDSSTSAHNVVKPPPQPPPPRPQINSESWLIQTTAKASYYNLGGHVDKNGVVDSLASG